MLGHVVNILKCWIYSDGKLVRLVPCVVPIQLLVGSGGVWGSLSILLHRELFQVIITSQVVGEVRQVFIPVRYSEVLENFTKERF